MEKELLSIKNLTIHYETDDGVVEAVNNVSFSLNRGEVLGLVGETGAGKTTIALSIMGLLPVPPSHVINGEIILDGQKILKMSDKELQKIRGRRAGMIFQDPMTALNPVKTIGKQVEEVIRKHKNVNAVQARQLALEILEKVGIREERFDDYPHQFSGGMKQRVIIAIALACQPDLLIADEPTTALDVTIQAQVLSLMKSLQEQMGTAMIMITHDFGIVAEVCDRCAVIYAGEIVEIGTVEHIFNRAMHPYTVGLFEAIPSLDKKVRRLRSIDGIMVNPTQLPKYCSFYDRCPMRQKECMETDPVLEEVEPGHMVKCIQCGRKAVSHVH